MKTREDRYKEKNNTNDLKIAGAPVLKVSSWQFDPDVLPVEKQFPKRYIDP